MKEYRKRKLRRTRKDKLRKKKRIVIFFIAIVIITFSIFKSKKENKLPEETAETFASIDNNAIQNENNDIVEEKTPEIDSKMTDWNLILVNKENKIPDDYQFELSTIEYGNKVDSRIAEALTKMLNAARKEGLKPLICSSYRTSNTQITLFNNKVNQYKKRGYEIQEAEEQASYWVARPRTSEHEIGMAVDIVSKNFQVLDERQENTAVQKWLIEHCNDYGFILRYPTDKREITKINYEPWHYRYVGIENAKFMKERAYCLEEYTEYLKKY